MATDLAASRHRMGTAVQPTTVGRVHILDHGTLSLDQSLMQFGPTLATIDNPHRAANWLSIPSYSVLIECQNHRVLFDTGSHPDFDSRWSDALKPLEVLNAAPECFLP